MGSKTGFDQENQVLPLSLSAWLCGEPLTSSLPETCSPKALPAFRTVAEALAPSSARMPVLHHTPKARLGDLFS